MRIMGFNLVNGDCLDYLWLEADNSFDALITDPPAGISFMGKEWDHHKGGRDSWIKWLTEVMTECHRVLKPGAHGLVWALPRTSHWTATALEDAGFEVRDVVTHLFGSGFPKSLDIGKAIDKAAGAEREVVGKFKYRPNDYRQEGSTTMKVAKGGIGDKQEFDITIPATDAAKQWQGWGTALKPASEHWILVRKKCAEKTVAANVLGWDTGGINIDASRIESSENKDRTSYKYTGDNGVSMGAASVRQRQNGSGSNSLNGRFPANLILDEEAAAMLDEQSGELHLRGNKKETTLGGGMYGHGEFRGIGLSESGYAGASRFFYVAKASKRERGEDNKHPTVKAQKLMQYLIKLITPPGGIILDPFMGSGSTGVAARKLGFKFTGIEKELSYYKIAEARLS